MDGESISASSGLLDDTKDSKFRGTWSVRVSDPKPHQFFPPPLPGPPANPNLNKPIASVLAKYAPQLVGLPQTPANDVREHEEPAPKEPTPPPSPEPVVEEVVVPELEPEISVVEEPPVVDEEVEPEPLVQEEVEPELPVEEHVDEPVEAEPEPEPVEPEEEVIDETEVIDEPTSPSKIKDEIEVDPERKEQKSSIKIDPNSTPLIRAVWDGDVEKATQILLENPEAIHDRDNITGTPVICLASQWAALIPMMELLVEKYGANPNDKATNSPMIPMGAAAALGIVENLDYLLNHGALIDGVEDTTIPLVIAAQNGHLEAVKLLVNRGANIKKRVSGEGNNAICQAAYKGHTHVVSFLHSQGCPLGTLPGSGVSPLLLASSNGHLDTVKWLVEKKAPLEGYAKDGASALFYAAKNNHKHIVSFLASKGANLMAPLTATKTTALHLAAQKGNKDMVLLLVELGAGVDLRLAGGQTPLYLATKYEHHGIVKCLLVAGADPMADCRQGRTPYSLALQLHAEMVVTMMQETIKNTPKKRSPVRAGNGSKPTTPKTPTNLTRQISLKSPASTSSPSDKTSPSK